MAHDEPGAVAERYARREDGDRYSALRPEIWQRILERQRVFLRRLATERVTDVRVLRLTEVGCGSGANLLELLRLGFRPEHLIGIELLPERQREARLLLPESTEVWQGDAAVAPVQAASQDLVLQSTVFSSLLDDAFQERLAAQMWSWLKPGGAVVWYDFVVDNPHNPDVRGVSRERIRRLFPQARISFDRLTLAPPVARRVCAVHPSLYGAVNLLPFLRTHVLAWAAKPVDKP
jgi:SAM-dependent methyltransferase